MVGTTLKREDDGAPATAASLLVAAPPSATCGGVSTRARFVGRVVVVVESDKPPSIGLVVVVVRMASCTMWGTARMGVVEHLGWELLEESKVEYQCVAGKKCRHRILADACPLFVRSHESNRVVLIAVVNRMPKSPEIRRWFRCSGNHDGSFLSQTQTQHHFIPPSWAKPRTHRRLPKQN